MGRKRTETVSLPTPGPSVSPVEHYFCSTCVYEFGPTVLRSKTQMSKHLIQDDDTHTISSSSAKLNHGAKRIDNFLHCHCRRGTIWTTLLIRSITFISWKLARTVNIFTNDNNSLKDRVVPRNTSFDKDTWILVTDTTYETEDSESGLWLIYRNWVGRTEDVSGQRVDPVRWLQFPTR